VKVQVTSTLSLMLFLLSFVNIASASEESFTEQFLGSPLLVLTAIIVIDIIALIYRKIRK
jgi:hypothetical protein